MCAGQNHIVDMDTLNSEQRSVGWGLGAAQWQQLSKLATTPALIRLYQLLLFTMPGTPVFTYGDEIGLQAGQVSSGTDETLKCFDKPTAPKQLNLLSFPPFSFIQGSESPKMVWDIEKEPGKEDAVNATAEVGLSLVRESLSNFINARTKGIDLGFFFFYPKPKS